MYGCLQMCNPLFCMWDATTDVDRECNNINRRKTEEGKKNDSAYYQRTWDVTFLYVMAIYYKETLEWGNVCRKERL